VTSVQTAGNCGNTRRRRVKVDFLPYIIFSVCQWQVAAEWQCAGIFFKKSNAAAIK
jgi:hypothetical protein